MSDQFRCIFWPIDGAVVPVYEYIYVLFLKDSLNLPQQMLASFKVYNLFIYFLNAGLVNSNIPGVVALFFFFSIDADVDGTKTRKHLWILQE